MSMVFYTRSQKITSNVGIDLVPVDATFNAESTAEDADLSNVPEEKWVHCARSKNGTHSQQVQQDEEDSYDMPTRVRVKASNETVTGNSYEFELERTSMLFDAMAMGVEDPFSEEAAAAVSSGKAFRIHASNLSATPVGVRMREFHGSKLMSTKWFYADARVEPGKNWDGKIVRPKLKLEVTPSVHTKQQNDPNYTGQPVQED